MATLPEQLQKNIAQFLPEHQELIKKAYFFAAEKHKDQKRRSGEPYIIHPVFVAEHLAADGHDYISVIAALLHDTLEDTQTTQAELIENFGAEISRIIEGITKISSIKIKNKSELFSDNEMFMAEVDNYRKILLATISDLRIIIIKLYDRLHNIETIEFMADHKKKFYARETIEIYAPIAERLGMGEMKGRLEDLSFPYAYPREYEKFTHSTAADAYKNPKNVIEKITPKVAKALTEDNIRYYSISGRSKHLYSLFVKLKRKKDISLIFDIVALRVIVETVEDCYKTLGVIHSLYMPVPGRIYDYIARPKSSGYQSLHTTVRDEENNVFEIQIRTEDMHHYAEYGAGAHWNYKEKNTPESAQEWLEELKKIQNIQSGKDLIKVIKEELFSQKVFVFTPKGKILDLPSGSCSVDFAYRIHTDVGNHCKGTRINGRLMPLKTRLNTGDVVEIMTSNNAVPSESWLNFVKTSGAKNKINHYLRELNFDQYLEAGKKLINDLIEKNSLPQLEKNKAQLLLIQSTLPYNDLENALAAVGQKHLSKFQLIRVLFPQFTNKTISKREKKSKEISPIAALKDIRHSYAGCCKPKPQDKVIGYLTKEHIIKVHKQNCKRLSSVNKDRLIKL